MSAIDRNLRRLSPAGRRGLFTLNALNAFPFDVAAVAYYVQAHLVKSAPAE